MLRQILSAMQVPPELLAELSDEQKQLLFVQMRQEQLRRWRDTEAEAESDPRRAPAARTARGKSVHWKLGADGDVWVWVMGEHRLDKPYDLLCDELTAERETRRRRRPSLQEAEAQSCLGEACPEPSVTSRGAKFRSGVGENCGEQQIPEGVTEAPPAGSALKQDGLQTAANKSRSVEEMLADSISQSRKQTKDTRMRNTMNQSQARGEAPPNPVDSSTQNADQEDPIWLESLRRSKAEDQRRRSLAKHARDDYKRLSLQGKNKGKATDDYRTGRTGEQRRRLPLPPPLPPKPKTLPPSARLANGPPAWHVDDKEG